MEETEEVVAVFRCAYSKDILHQGKLYITPRRFCFHSNIFGFEDKVTLDCQNVTAITRAKAALIFPTAILVRCGDIKYLFASFLNREQVYRLMFRVWQSVLMGTVLTVEELTQSKKYHYRRLEHDIKPEGSLVPVRSKSADEGHMASILEDFHAEFTHRRTRSFGSSVSATEVPDQGILTDEPQVGHLIRKSQSAIEIGLPAATSAAGQECYPPVKKPRVSFDLKKGSETESTGRESPITEGESNKTDSSDPEQPETNVFSSSATSSSQEVVKRKKQCKLSKLLHLHHAQHVKDENHMHESSLSPVEKALDSALSLGISAVPCAVPKRSALWPLPVVEKVSSAGLKEEKDPQETETQYGDDIGAEYLASDSSFQTNLKRIPVEISSRVSASMTYIQARAYSVPGLTLLMVLVLVCFVLVCLSTIYVTCQLASVEPVLATVHPLTFVFWSDSFHQEKLSSAHLKDLTIDKLAAHLEDFDKSASESQQTTEPDNGLLRSTSDSVGKSVFTHSESIAETHD